MPFPCKARIRLAPSVPVVVLEDVTLESGELTRETVDLGKEVLPDASLFDLKNQLKAGVDLEEVSSKIVRHSRVSGKTLAQKLGLTETPNNKEVTNEG